MPGSSLIQPKLPASEWIRFEGAGHINRAIVQEEIDRLNRAWSTASNTIGKIDLGDVIGENQIERLDLFDQTQLEVVVQVCRESNSLSDAGRKLFGVSRQRKSTVNDSDRVRKYLAKHDLAGR